MVNKGRKITVQKTKYVDMKIQGGILYMYYRPLNLMDLDVAKSIVKDRLTFSDGIAYPCLFDVREVKEASKEARDFMANEGNELVVASAMLVHSPLLKMIVNFYINVNSPKNPSRMFTSEESAVEWLSQYVT